MCDVWFELPANNVDASIEFTMEGFDGVNGHMASVTWVKRSDPAFDWEQWKKWGPGADWEDIPGGRIPVSRGWYQWHNLVLTIDYAAQQYVSMKIDGAFFDMRGVPYEIRPGAQGPYLAASFLTWNQTDVAAQAAIGKVSLGWE